jgi:hypothetical protein
MDRGNVVDVKLSTYSTSYPYIPKKHAYVLLLAGSRPYKRLVFIGRILQRGLPISTTKIQHEKDLDDTKVFQDLVDDK